MLKQLHQQMMTPNRLQTYWDQVKPFIKSQWPLISDTALNQINGNYDRFLKYLKEAYNNFPLEEARVRDKLQRFFNQLEKIN